MYYEAGTTVKTHPQIPYNDGVRRIFLYTNGKLPEGAGDDDKKLMNLLRYIGNSREENVTDDDTRRLNEMVKSTKADKKVGLRYLKSWELEKALREEGRKEGREEGREKALISLVCKKLKKGKNIPVIADELEEEEKTIAEICEVAEHFAPDYDVDKIYEAFQEKTREDMSVVV